MSAEQVLEDCRRVKEAGTSSKVPVPIVTLEKLCRDALAWQTAPQILKDAVRAGQ
jgi:hypothetical protein